MTLILWLTAILAELYDVRIGNNLIAATHDIDYLANLNIRGGDRMIQS